MPTLTFEQRMRNVASYLMEYTEVKRPHNGRGRSATYAASVDAIALTGRQLAQYVLDYLDAGGLDGAHGLDGEVLPAGVVDDDLPFQAPGSNKQQEEERGHDISDQRR